MLIKKIPRIIPPRSRVGLIRAGRQTPSWKKAIGRQFRIGFYSRKDGLDCIWLVNENGAYEQTTDRAFLVKYFDVEHLSQEKENFYGRGKRRLRKIRIPTPLERLNGRSSIEPYEGAKEIWQKDDPDVVRPVINVLLHGQRVLSRAAAAYALNLMHGNAAVLALEKSLETARTSQGQRAGR